MITESELKHETVRALSFKQPYAGLMLHGKQETRTWMTAYTGLVLICASLQPYTEPQISIISGGEHGRRALQLIDLKTAHRGCAIAIGRLVGSRPMIEADEKSTFVKHLDDLYVHMYSNVRPIVPFKWRGKQGWCTLTPEQKKQIILL